MRSCCAPPITRLAVIASLMPLLAACAGAASSVQLPSKGASAHTTSVRNPRRPSTRDQVIAAFTGYNTALRAAGNSRSAARVRQLMRPYISSATITNLIRFDRSIWSKDEIFYGRVVYHILAVRVDGDHAFVHDCDNTSGSGLENASTGEVVRGSIGVSHQNIVTRLNLVDGRWLIGLQTIEDVPCKP